jgi:hypothetical protein
MIDGEQRLVSMLDAEQRLVSMMEAEQTWDRFQAE